MSTRLQLAVFVLSFVSAPLYGNPITLVGSGGSTWHTGQPAAEDNSTPGTPYWDSNSWDSDSLPDGAASYNPANIGALLLGASAALVPSMAAAFGTPYSLGADAPLAFEFWGDTTQAADPNVSFSHAGGAATYTLRILAELARRQRFNEVGWYRAGDPSVLHTIFAGSDSRGATWTGTIDGDFGFYYRDATRNLLYLTQTALAGQTPGSSQQFATFRNGDLFFLGIEDRFGPITQQACGEGTCSDYDYNDFLISFEQTEPVPEPGTLLMLGSGLLAAAVVARRRRG